MDKAIITAINATPKKAFIAVTGGGQNFIGDYLAVEGGSAKILGFYVPYTQQLFDEFVEGKPDNYSSEEAARKLAVASYKKAVALVGAASAIGIGAASSVASANERVGRQHRLNVAVQTENRTEVISYVLNQTRKRENENYFLSSLILYFLASASGMESYLPKIDYDTSEKFNHFIAEPNKQIVELVHKERDFVCSKDIFEDERLVLFCGSFNPFHAAHAEICKIVESITKVKPYVELSVANTNKPFMDYVEIERRVKDIKAHNQNVLLTHAPRYLDKVQMLVKDNPNVLKMNFGITFVVGADTWLRIWDEKYGFSVEKLIEDFKENDVNFIVFARDGKKMLDYREVVESNQYWKEIESLVIPSPEADSFNLSLSSTELRKHKI